ncbi:MAG: hypothetical protein KDD99_24640 [Bacteroidetes bacterium]|nr:hypothetical protein [Bacteroidota bacterium]
MPHILNIIIPIASSQYPWVFPHIANSIHTQTDREKTAHLSRLDLLVKPVTLFGLVKSYPKNGTPKVIWLPATPWFFQ